MLLVIYVDDFKMSGPEDRIMAVWEMIETKIRISKPAKVDQYLGCKHEYETCERNGKKGMNITYNMQGFLESCCALYEELAENR